MPLKGVEKVRGRYQALIKEISGPRTVKVVNAIVATGAAYAKLYTPVDTSALINSQRKQVSDMGSGINRRVKLGVCCPSGNDGIHHLYGARP